MLFKIIKFLIINAIGFFTISGLFVAAHLMDIVPTDLPEQYQARFSNFFFGGTMWAWIICALLSLFYFEVKSNLKFLFLCLPVLGPALYGTAVLFYFN
jgi:hypothetical protein